MAALQTGLAVPNTLTLVLLLLILIYAKLFMWLRYGWKKLSTATDFTADSKLPGTSLIIALRNEEENMEGLLSCLTAQDYPENRLEIILVDDHSGRPLAQNTLVRAFNKYPLRAIRLPDEQQGKKQALLLGAQAATHEILLFTDADCHFGPSWIRSQVSVFRKKSIQLQLGLVGYCQVHSWAQQFFQFDFQAMVMTGAASAALGRATLCNGANLTIRRKAYLEATNSLRFDLPSGDDIFLLHAIKAKYPHGIAVNRNLQGMVSTPAPGSVLQFLNQRIRWGSKARHYTDGDSIILTLVVLLGNTAFLVALISSVMGYLSYTELLLAFTLKATTDTLFLSVGWEFFRGQKQAWKLPIFSCCYPFYLVCAAFASIIMPYRWKGRTG